MSDFDHAMGQSAQDRGQIGSAKFATEVEVAEARSQMRIEDKKQLVVTFWKRLIEKLIKLIKANFMLTFSKFIDMSSIEADTFQQLTFHDLNIDVNIEIDIQSQTLKTEAIEKKQFIEFLQALNNVLSLIGIAPSLLKTALEKFRIPNKDKILEEIQANINRLQEMSQQKTNISTSESPTKGTEMPAGSGQLPSGGI